VYFHLEQFTESLHFALGAGDLFDVSNSNEYVDTLIGMSIFLISNHLISLLSSNSTQQNA